MGQGRRIAEQLSTQAIMFEEMRREMRALRAQVDDVKRDQKKMTDFMLRISRKIGLEDTA